MLKLALIYILVISCTPVTGSRKEVAVIFGGYQQGHIVTDNDEDSSEEETLEDQTSDKEVKNINSPFL